MCSSDRTDLKGEMSSSKWKKISVTYSREAQKPARIKDTQVSLKLMMICADYVQQLEKSLKEIFRTGR